MKNIVNKWWFWAIVAVVGIVIYLNRNDKELKVKLTDKPAGDPAPVVTQ